MQHCLRKHELSTEEIADLTRLIHNKITTQNKAFELLPYYGFLYFRNKIWQGKVFRLEETVPEDASIKEAASHPSFYMMEINPVIVEEMQSAEAMEVSRSGKYFTLFSLDDGNGYEQHNNIYKMSAKSACEFINMEEFDPIFSGKDSIMHIDLVTLRSGLYSCIHEYISVMPFEASNRATAFITVLQDSASAKFTSVSPTLSGYEIRKMNLKETLYAAERWSHATATTNLRMSSSWKLGLAFGAFTVDSAMPVCWAVISTEGAISALQTLPEHRRKGLAKAVIKSISLEVLQRSFVPYVFIEDVETSVVQISLFASLGFEIFRDTTFCWSWLSQQSDEANSQN